MSILKHGHQNFSVIMLEDMGRTNTITKDLYIAREQFYIDWALKTYGLGVLNILKQASSSLGFRHTKETIAKMSIIKKGEKNPMYGKPKSAAFIAHQERDKSGPNNPQFGVKKSEETLAKLRKIIYVYDANDSYKLVGIYSTVECKSTLKIGYDTLIKRIADGKIHKGYFFSKEPYSPNS